MKKALIALVASAFLLTAAVTIPDKEFEDYDAYRTDVELVCEKITEEFKGRRCIDIAEPTVITTWLIEAVGRGVRGLHIPGEPYIFVHPRVPNPYRQEVILHETVHYVMEKMRLIPGETFEERRCPSEALARRWTSEIMDQPEDPNWRERYGCREPNKISPSTTR